MPKNKKIILLYPYYNGISGAYNRYLLLEKLLRKTNFEVKLIILDSKDFNFFITKIVYKFIKYLQVESLIIFYSIFRNYYFITDFNPSIIALFSKNIFIQIHDVSWINKNGAMPADWCLNNGICNVDFDLDNKVTFSKKNFSFTKDYK